MYIMHWLLVLTYTFLEKDTTAYLPEVRQSGASLSSLSATPSGSPTLCPSALLTSKLQKRLTLCLLCMSAGSQS